MSGFSAGATLPLPGAITLSPPCLQHPLVLNDGDIADQPQRLWRGGLLAPFLHRRRGRYSITAVGQTGVSGAGEAPSRRWVKVLHALADTCNGHIVQ